MLKTSAVCILKAACLYPLVRSLQSAVRSPQSAVRSPQSASYTDRLETTKIHINSREFKQPRRRRQ